MEITDSVETSKNVSGEMGESECSTVPTDLTLSLGSESSPRLATSNIGAYDRKKWIQEFHLIKLELSKKNLLIQNLKSDFVNKVEELEEKLADSHHQQTMIKLRMETQINIKEDLWKKREKSLKEELNETRQKVAILEADAERLKEETDSLVMALKIGDLDQKYQELKNNIASASPFQQILHQLYEVASQYKIQNVDLVGKLEISKKQYQEYKDELERQKEEKDKYENDFKSLENKYQLLVEQFTELKKLVDYGNYAQGNFARVKEERDKLQIEVTELNETISSTNAENIALTKERDSLKNDVLHMRQQQIFFQKENEHIGKQLTAMTQQLGEAQDRISQLSLQLESARKARENMFNKFITARDKFKIEYEARLRHDMDEIRNNSNQEINRMKENMNLFYEKEISAVQQARDTIAKEKEALQDIIKETREKYEHLQQKSQNQHLEEKNKILHLTAEVQQKNYEIDKLLQIDKDKSLDLSQKQLENEKLNAKLEAVNLEFQFLEQKQRQLENEVTNKTLQLEQYKKFEKELNEVSNIEQKGNDNQVVQPMPCSFDKSASVLSKLQQGMALLKTTVDLEKKVSTLQQELAMEREHKKKYEKELTVANNLLSFAKKPHSLLMNAMREKEIVISQLHQKINCLENKIENQSDEYSKLMLAHKGLAEELERIIKNREELGKVKQLLITLHEKQGDTVEEPRKITRVVPPYHAGSHHVLGYTASMERPKKS